MIHDWGTGGGRCIGQGKPTALPSVPPSLTHATVPRLGVLLLLYMMMIGTGGRVFIRVYVRTYVQTQPVAPRLPVRTCVDAQARTVRVASLQRVAKVGCRRPDVVALMVLERQKNEAVVGKP
jgi:hypothetical protein